MARELTPKQKIFCLEYVKCHNATEAARIAGLKHADVQGPRLLGNVRIKAEIEQYETNLKVDLRTQFSQAAEEAFKDLLRLRENLKYDERVGAQSLRMQIDESILDRAGYKPVDKKELNAVVNLSYEDQLKELIDE